MNDKTGKPAPTCSESRLSKSVYFTLFMISSFLFLHRRGHEWKNRSEQHCAAEEIPEIRLTDQIADSKYDHRQPDHREGRIKSFLKACLLGDQKKYQSDNQRNDP